MKNIYWFMKYNTLKLKSGITIKNLQKELTLKLNEIHNLNIANKELMEKATLKNKRIRELKEIVLESHENSPNKTERINRIDYTKKDKTSEFDTKELV